MDLNGAENAFNMIEMESKAERRANGWPKNKKELADRIDMAIKRKSRKSGVVTPCQVSHLDGKKSFVEKEN